MFAKLLLQHNSGTYWMEDYFNEKMNILGFFLTHDVVCYNISSYREWTLDDSLGYCVSGNIICLRKDNDTIILSDLFEEEDEEVTEVLKMSRQQFVKLLDDWKEKVCKVKPKEVVIKCENDEFIIETKN